LKKPLIIRRSFPEPSVTTAPVVIAATTASTAGRGRRDAAASATTGEPARPVYFLRARLRPKQHPDNTAPNTTNAPGHGTRRQPVALSCFKPLCHVGALLHRWLSQQHGAPPTATVVFFHAASEAGLVAVSLHVALQHLRVRPVSLPVVTWRHLLGLVLLTRATLLQQPCRLCTAPIAFKLPAPHDASACTRA